MNTNQDPLNLILGRRSIRVYAAGTVTDNQVTRLLEAAMAAPSAMSKDPWRFVVVRDTGTLGQLAQLLPGGKMLPTASVAIAVCGDLDAAFERNISFLLQDCSASIENLLLAAHGLGLGACWVGCHPAESGIKGVRQLLNLPGSFVPVAVVALGLPGEHLEARTRYNPSSVRTEKWS
jgi:nitroreductase